jgi:hypothetical protein
MFNKYNVQFLVWTSLNQNQTFQTCSLRSGPTFSKIAEPNLESGSGFTEILKEPDLTGPWHR